MRVETASTELACALQEEGLALLLRLHRGGGGVLLRLSHWTRIHGTFVFFTWTISVPSGVTLGGVFVRALMSLRLLSSVHPKYCIINSSASICMLMIHLKSYIPINSETS